VDTKNKKGRKIMENKGQKRVYGKYVTSQEVIEILASYGYKITLATLHNMRTRGDIKHFKQAHKNAPIYHLTAEIFAIGKRMDMR